MVPKEEQEFARRLKTELENDNRFPTYEILLGWCRGAKLPKRNLDWTSKSEVEGAVFDAAKRCKNDFPQYNESTAKPETSRYSAGEALAIATKLELGSQVHEIRKRYFGKAEAPFDWILYDTDKAAFMDAWIWLRAHIKEPLQAPEFFTQFSLRVVGHDPQAAFRKFLQGMQSTWYTSEKKLAAQTFQEIANSLEDEPVKLELVRGITTGNVSSVTLEMLEPSAESWIISKLQAFNGGTRMLWENCEDIAKRSGWWEPRQALEHILVDTLPQPSIDIRYKTTWDFNVDSGEIPDTITMTIRSPTTPEQLAERYRSFLRENGWKVSKLSPTHKALLELEAETPGLTWAQRTLLWSQRYKPGMTNFAGPNMARWMRKDASRAKTRGRWQFTRSILEEGGWVEGSNGMKTKVIS
jgi:hypothetical protein